jgi:hypothetical protein
MESNHRHLPYKSNALHTELQGHIMHFISLNKIEKKNMKGKNSMDDTVCCSTVNFENIYPHFIFSVFENRKPLFFCYTLDEAEQFSRIMAHNFKQNCKFPETIIIFPKYKNSLLRLIISRKDIKWNLEQKLTEIKIRKIQKGFINTFGNIKFK